MYLGIYLLSLLVIAGFLLWEGEDTAPKKDPNERRRYQPTRTMRGYIRIKEEFRRM
jgi:hypothetical protein